VKRIRPEHVAPIASLPLSSEGHINAVLKRARPS
jgi:hypothetical protein